MRKIFSILVVLMMVAGTFVSCSMPTNDTSTSSVSTVNISATDIPNCGLSYLVLTDGNKAICTDKFAELIKSVSDKQSVLDAQHRIGIHNGKPEGWDGYIYYVSDSDKRFTEASWSSKQSTLTIYGCESEKTINTKADLGFSIHLSTERY